MDIDIRRSALRHGVSEDRIRYVIEHCQMPLYPPPESEDELDLVVFLGPDRDGIDLEVAAIELAGSGLRVIHAMKLRDKYRDHYRRVMGWPKQR